jgi:hypothetical protein
VMNTWNLDRILSCGTPREGPRVSLVGLAICPNGKSDTKAACDLAVFDEIEETLKAAGFNGGNVPAIAARHGPSPPVNPNPAQIGGWLPSAPTMRQGQRRSHGSSKRS